MGVPGLFKFICQRYPCCVGSVTQPQMLEFDNLYLDMNGIFHICSSHESDIDSNFRSIEERIFHRIFHYIEALFLLIKPKKLLFFAVDGTTPQAKMMNQRSRRFMAAKEKFEKTLGKEFHGFDRNCITPGTVFMENLNTELKNFIINKISTDPLWQNCKIIFSGCKTPGEGEHKVLDYIRYIRTQPDHDPNTRHCFYGADADLIMLGLLTHEPNFVIIKEKLSFLKLKKKPSINFGEMEFNFIYLSILKDYLDLEFDVLKDKLSFEYDLDRIIDDWVLMTFLLGNDFIPKLPDFYINTNAFPILYKVYKEVLPTLEDYLNKNGQLNLAGFREFMKKLSEYEIEAFKEAFADFAYLEGKMNRNLIHNDELTEEELIDEALKALAEPVTKPASESIVEPTKESIGELTLEPTVKPIVKTSRKTDLENLIKSTNDMLQISDEEIADKEENTLLLEFCQKKKKYYMENMGCDEVTDEFLIQQAEDYVEAVQWTLYYYYLGCQSWKWFYASHCSPFISDIANFIDPDFDFEMGEPLPPLFQLLAILPPASKNLVPEAFQHLMTSPNSPIIDFYPEFFETYLQAQQNMWEAIPLIQLIDRKRLLDAVEPYKDQLTKEEINRNTYQPMQIYSYTQKNLGIHKSSKYFPSISKNHAVVINVALKDISVEKSKLKFGCLKNASHYLNSTFPSLKYIPHTGALKYCKVVALSYPSKEESILLTLTKKEFPSLEVLAENLIGKVIYVNWPFMNKARVVAVSDSEKLINLTDNQKTEKVLPKDIQVNQRKMFSYLHDDFLKKKAIEMGKIEVVVMVKLLEGRKYLINSDGNLENEKIWSSTATTWPLQAVVTDLSDHFDRQECKSIEDAYQVGSTVFILGKPYFGAKGEILPSSDTVKNGFLKVAVEILDDFSITESLKMTKVSPYMSTKNAAQCIGMNFHLFSRITGFIFIHTTSEEENSDKKNLKINIGLAMKLSSRNKELPGYTKKNNDFWLYSKRATNVVAEYMNKFPKVVEYLSINIKNDFYKQEEIFPGPDGAAQMQEITDWIQQLEYQDLEFVEFGSEILEPEVIEDLEKAMANHQKKSKIRIRQMKPSMLFKNDLVMGKSSLVHNAKHCLLDRVVSIKSCPVPVGLRGVIVGIIKGTTENENMYNILFDEPFLGGEKIHKFNYQGHKLPATDFLNITNADRKEKTTALIGVPQVLEKPTSLRLAEPKTNPSAFVPWRQSHSSPDKTTDDQFQEIWSSLQAAKPQEGAMALKKLLKIKDESEATFEGPVKMFFEKMKASPLNKVPNAPVSSGFISTENCKPVEPNVSKFVPEKLECKQNNYFEQICAYHKQRNLPQPQISHESVCDKFVATLICHDGKIYSSLPRGSKDWATENVAKKAFTALTKFIPDNQEHYQNTKHENVLANQIKMTKSLMKAEVEAPSGSKEPRARREEPEFQSRRREYYENNLGPRSLPLPPEQWVAKSPKSEHFYHHQNSRRVERKNHRKDAKTESEESNSNKSNLTLKFVPLQAIIGKCSFKPIATTRSETCIKTDQPTETVKKPKAKNSSLEEKSTRKDGRRPYKIAANLNFDMNL